MILVFHDFAQLDTNFSLRVSFQHILDKEAIDLHIEHIEGASDDSAQEVAVPQRIKVLRREDHEVSERVLAQDQAKLLLVLLVWNGCHVAAGA